MEEKLQQKEFVHQKIVRTWQYDWKIYYNIIIQVITLLCMCIIKDLIYYTFLYFVQNTIPLLIIIIYRLIPLHIYIPYMNNINFLKKLRFPLLLFKSWLKGCYLSILMYWFWETKCLINSNYSRHNIFVQWLSLRVYKFI